MSTSIGTALARLRATTRLRGHKFPGMVDQMIKTYPDAGFERPIENDQLFVSTYNHVEHEDNCSKCKVDEMIHRKPREKPGVPSGRSILRINYFKILQSETNYIRNLVFHVLRWKLVD